jgi:hypothetical protein
VPYFVCLFDVLFQARIQVPVRIGYEQDLFQDKAVLADPEKRNNVLQFVVVTEVKRDVAPAGSVAFEPV